MRDNLIQYAYLIAAAAEAHDVISTFCFCFAVHCYWNVWKYSQIYEFISFCCSQTVFALVCVTTFRNHLFVWLLKKSRNSVGCIIANRRYLLGKKWAIISYGNSWLISKPSSWFWLGKKLYNEIKMKPSLGAAWWTRQLHVTRVCVSSVSTAKEKKMLDVHFVFSNHLGNVYLCVCVCVSVRVTLAAAVHFVVC